MRAIYKLAICPILGVWFYRPKNVGGRFSKKAFTASLWSSVFCKMTCRAADISITVSKLAMLPSRINFFVIRRACGGC